MRVIQEIDLLRSFLSKNNAGILADTGFLYASADMHDRLYKQSLEVSMLLAEFNVPTYINIIGRLEFVDLMFRRQLTLGAIAVYESMPLMNTHRVLFNFLKSIRDENTAHLRQGRSYKIAEGKLKKLRNYFEVLSPAAWSQFCHQYAGEKLSNEWVMLEEELGLQFIEVLEGETSEIIERPLYWKDMIQLMGSRGLRGPDAMIFNVFLKSRLPLLITTDSDIVSAFTDEAHEPTDKYIFHLK